jgi:hypothetical protein
MEVGVPGDDQATTEKQLQAKLAVLHALRTADVRRTLLGQYDGYRDHVRHDHKGEEQEWRDLWGNADTFVLTSSFLSCCAQIRACVPPPLPSLYFLF